MCMVFFPIQTLLFERCEVEWALFEREVKTLYTSLAEEVEIVAGGFFGKTFY